MVRLWDLGFHSRLWKRLFSSGHRPFCPLQFFTVLVLSLPHHWLPIPFPVSTPQAFYPRSYFLFQPVLVTAPLQLPVPISLSLLVPSPQLFSTFYPCTFLLLLHTGHQPGVSESTGESEALLIVLVPCPTLSWSRWELQFQEPPQPLQPWAGACSSALLGWHMCNPVTRRSGGWLANAWCGQNPQVLGDALTSL